ncbi:MAG: ECF-type sigma factor [Paludibaculum sp.]
MMRSRNWPARMSGKPASSSWSISAGLTYEEAAAALEISPATLHRDLRLAKAWLQTVLTPEPRP